MASKRKGAGKRRKNEGSAYPIRRNGTIVGWQAAVTINGKAERRNAPTAEAAEAARLELIRLRDAKIDVGSGRQTLHCWLEEWLKIVRSTRNLRPTTLQGYAYSIEAYILPALGTMRLDEIKAHHIQAMLDTLMADVQRASDQRRSGVRTAQAAALQLKQTFDLAVERGYLLRSPMDGVVLPVSDAAPIVPVSEEQIAALLALTCNDIDQTIVGSQQHYYALSQATLWHVYALLGLRRGEGLGLRWTDLDWDAATIAVTRQITVVVGSGPTVGKIKTKAGVRTLPLPPVLISLLRRLQTAQSALRLRQGSQWQDNGYIIASRTGGPLWPTYVDLSWRAIRARVGLPAQIRVHTLRHTLATMLDETEGCTESVKSAIIGHGPKTITQHYTHARIAAMRRVLERMTDRVLARKMG